MILVSMLLNFLAFSSNKDDAVGAGPPFMMTIKKS